MKSTQSEEKSPAAGKSQRAEESRQGSKTNAEKGKTVGQSSMKNEGREEDRTRSVKAVRKTRTRSVAMRG